MRVYRFFSLDGSPSPLTPCVLTKGESEDANNLPTVNVIVVLSGSR